MINHIQLGIKEKFYFNYNGEMITLRPISSLELDQSFFNALRNTEEEISDLVIKIKLKLIDNRIDIDNKRLSSILKYYNDVDYWIVYFAMKDFQNNEFSIDIVKQMSNIHQISKEVLSYSYQNKEVIQEIIKTQEGKIIASIIFNLNVPLGTLSELTDLQKDFLILSRIDKNKPKKHGLSKTGDKMNLGKILSGLI